MSAGGAGGLGGAAGSVSVAQAQAAAATQDAQEIISNQEASEQSLVRGNSDFTNPAASARTSKKENEFKSLESRRSSAAAKEKKSESTEEKSPDRDLADRFADETPELSATVLKSLRNAISDNDTPEDILRKVQEQVSDPKLQAQALEYLAISPSSSSLLKDNLARARAQHAATHTPSIQTDRGVSFAAEACSKELTCSPSSLRALYVSMTEQLSSFQEVRTLLLPNYSSQELKLVIHFLVTSMVAEMKSDGANIERPRLMCMLSGLYNMQSLLVTENIFTQGLAILEKQAKSEGTPLPPLTPRDLTNAFLNLVGDKFPTAAKTEKAVEQLVGPEPSAKTLVLNLFFSSLRKTPPRIFPSAEKRQQLAGILANTLDVININNEDYPQPGDFPKSSPIAHDYSAVNFAPPTKASEQLQGEQQEST